MEFGEPQTSNLKIGDNFLRLSPVLLAVSVALPPTQEVSGILFGCGCWSRARGSLRGLVARYERLAYGPVQLVLRLCRRRCREAYARVGVDGGLAVLCHQSNGQLLV